MNFAGNTFKGLKWTSFASVMNIGARLGQIAILTRFLPPEDFGVVAIALLFIQFTEVFLDMGLSSAVLYHSAPSKKQYSSLFWLNVFSGVIIYAILYFLTPLIADFYDESVLAFILPIISLNILFSSFGRLHKTIQQKVLNFKYIAIIETSSAVIMFISAGILAIQGFGIYSLVFSTILGGFVANAAFFAKGLLRDKNIAFYFSFYELKTFLRIGFYQMGGNLLDFFSRELDIIIISTTLGKEILGIYSLSKQLVFRLFFFVNPTITRVLTPLFARLQNDKSMMANKYLQVIELLAFFNFPIYFLIATISSSLLTFVYGESYAEAGFILQILSINFALLSVLTPVGCVQIALGRTDLGFYWTIYRIISSFVFLYIGSFFSITGIVISILLNTVFNLYPLWRVQIYTMLKIPFSKQIKPQLRPLIVSFILFITLSQMVGVKIYWLDLTVIPLLFGIFYLGYCLFVNNSFTLSLKSFKYSD